MPCGSCANHKDDKLIGKVSHYYSHLGVAIIELEGDLAVGDKIKIQSGADEFEQEVKEMQVEHQNIQAAKKGDVIGLKVEQKTKEGGLVRKI